MTKPRAIWFGAFVLGTGVLVGSACTIRTGPPPEQQPTATATATPAPTPAATATTPAVATTSAAPTTSAPPPAATTDAGKYEPCSGKKCGDRCNVCPPHTPGCFETALVKMCHPGGQCKPATTVDCSKK